MAKANNKKQGLKSNLGEQKVRTGKRFLDKKDAALELAKSIVDVQEGKARKKAEKHHHHPKAQSAVSSDRKHRAPSAKDRLKQAKLSILAERARAKKEKAKLRKKANNEESTFQHPERIISDSKANAAESKPRKRVAFA